MQSKLSDLWNILTRSEMWAAIAVIVGAIYQANVLPESWSKIAALALAVLAALGYGVNRTMKKIGDAKANAIVEAAQKVNP